MSAVALLLLGSLLGHNALDAGAREASHSAPRDAPRLVPRGEPEHFDAHFDAAFLRGLRGVEAFAFVVPGSRRATGEGANGEATSYDASGATGDATSEALAWPPVAAWLTAPALLVRLSPTNGIRRGKGSGGGGDDGIDKTARETVRAVLDRLLGALEAAPRGGGRAADRAAELAAARVPDEVADALAESFGLGVGLGGSGLGSSFGIGLATTAGSSEVWCLHSIGIGDGSSGEYDGGPFMVGGRSVAALHGWRLARRDSGSSGSEDESYWRASLTAHKRVRDAVTASQPAALEPSASQPAASSATPPPALVLASAAEVVGRGLHVALHLSWTLALAPPQTLSQTPQWMPPSSPPISSLLSGSCTLGGVEVLVLQLVPHSA